jgi:hypothetical protein
MDLSVVRGGLGPQVKLGAIGLDLSPDGENAGSDKAYQEQLLHGRAPLTFACCGTGHSMTAIHGIPEA